MGISPISKFSKLCANRMGDVTRMNLCILTTSDCAFAFFHVISNEHCQPTAVFITFHPVSSVKISTNRNFVSWKFRQMVRRKIEKFLRTDEFCLSLAIASTPDSNWNSFLYFRHGNCYFPVESEHFLRNMIVSFLYLFFNFPMARVDKRTRGVLFSLCFSFWTARRTHTPAWRIPSEREDEGSWFSLRC